MLAPQPAPLCAPPPRRAVFRGQALGGTADSRNGIPFLLFRPTHPRVAGLAGFSPTQRVRPRMPVCPLRVRNAATGHGGHGCSGSCQSKGNSSQTRFLPCADPRALGRPRLQGHRRRYGGRARWPRSAMSDAPVPGRDQRIAGAPRPAPPGKISAPRPTPSGRAWTRRWERRPSPFGSPPRRNTTVEHAFGVCRPGDDLAFVVQGTSRPGDDSDDL